MFRTFLMLCALCAPGLAAAQEAPRTILVMDASGSMWGQIDGVAKITIAQQVMDDLLATLPDGQELGLAAYGHRTRGDCADIETLVVPGTGTRDAISRAVNGIKPRGKTPMTDAVIAAAEALRYTEEAATVILVSDGIETCNPDPCAAARVLEESGVNFTTHVVGFDVSDPEALAQMQCLAEETGGRFLTADNASELGDALEEVAAAPEPVAVTVTFIATEGEGGPRVTTDLMWSLSDGDTVLMDFERGASVSADLMPGTYLVSALRPEDEASAEAEISVGDANETVTLVLPALLPAASVSGPAEAEAGATIPIDWDGPDAHRDYIAVSKPGDNGYENYAYTSKGDPAQLLMPAEPGDYELRYVLNEGRKVLAAQPITVTATQATLEATDSAPAGATIPVTWDGPDYHRDYISVARPGDRGYVNYAYTSKGTPAQLVLPPEPGTYELRYVMSQDKTVLTTRMIEVTAVEATLDAPAQANAGEPLTVGWTGPDYHRDYIAVARPADRGYEAYTYTNLGTPLALKMPLEPGAYELRYVMSQNKTVLAVQPIEVVDVQASLDVPATAPAGSNIAVHWDGPGYDRDYISVARPSDPKYSGYTYTNKGNPLILRMPVEPGDYEIRYIANANGTAILGREPITLTEVTATLDARETGRAGGTLAVHWDGPDFKGDYIGLSRAGSSDSEYESYRYTSEDSPLVVELPEVPGDYELRYYIGQDRKVIARLAVSVE
ncbi:VWA domain-containing protein [Primorskyibacter aestuariivivens]|uniref:vWA domain-containing protein n=1 Tax=Primorskyibacter aestuariivivens TaxID=1888912 RepID=UPI0023015942|nr:VWA domain-containing protein [Primorskyibacter aestuariivivens]MDA7426879.1 VWA domain-containing protein [Primorskyibacter aestuariivivens]